MGSSVDGIEDCLNDSNNRISLQTTNLNIQPPM
jgi:hypothetical protein